MDADIESTEINMDHKHPTNDSEIPYGNVTKKDPLLAKFLCLPVPFGLYDVNRITASNFPICASAHACAISTEPSYIHPALGVGTLLIAASLTWIKILMLASIVVDSMTPRCTTNGQCNTGLWCAPLASLGLGDGEWPVLGRENSVCYDCMIAQMYNTSTLPDNQSVYILEGRDYCEARGDSPTSCDFVRSNRARMSVLTAIILFLLWTLIGKLIHEELKRVHCHLSLFKFRIERLRAHTTKIHIWSLQAASWLGETSRAFIYPTWMACATINLLVR